MIKKRTLTVLLSITPLSEASTYLYDPRYCYILDGFLLIYGIIITAFFVRERFTKKTNKPEESPYQAINKSGRDVYDVRNQRQAEEARGGRRRGEDAYMPLQKKTDDTYREIEVKPDRHRRGDQVYQGLSSGTRDTYDALHMQSVASAR
ncbi:T-cell surface glycoprotein CD3 zeta chain [Triplophysa rosa]|uniref:T-cell surface glycoprotein CD3 zeta chain n=1 Tax=Triplophysa rosa TaxID=992332 RepID=A0A9W8C909_TRIRA|nr:T-cell surface glycoprotein CD3 zeta chain [Triplophysa rosa]KAI7811450.1 CD247 molecule precursor [Triplophysa rosa]